MVGGDGWVVCESLVGGGEEEVLTRRSDEERDLSVDSVGEDIICSGCESVDSMLRLWEGYLMNVSCVGSTRV